MILDWFAGALTPESIKKRYRKLAMEHHPDHGGATATMQEINAQYKERLRMCDGFRSTDEKGNSYRYTYNEEVEQAIMDKINALLRLRMIGVEIALVGTWVWILGDTRPHRRELKAQSCMWNPKRKSWYWKPYKGRSHFNRGADFDGLARKYGFRAFGADPDDSVSS